MKIQWNIILIYNKIWSSFFFFLTFELLRPLPSLSLCFLLLDLTLHCSSTFQKQNEIFLEEMLIRNPHGLRKWERRCKLHAVSPFRALVFAVVANWRIKFFSSNESRSASPPPPLKLERPRSLSLYSEEEQKQRSIEMNTVPTPIVPDNQTKPFVPIMLETEKTEKNVKPSPSCAQEVTTGTNQHGHLDLKFYHSPLWWSDTLADSYSSSSRFNEKREEELSISRQTRPIWVSNLV